MRLFAQNASVKTPVATKTQVMRIVAAKSLATEEKGFALSAINAEALLAIFHGITPWPRRPVQLGAPRNARQTRHARLSTNGKTVHTGYTGRRVPALHRVSGNENWRVHLPPTTRCFPAPTNSQN